jgi:hypothetical protein
VKRLLIGAVSVLSLGAFSLQGATSVAATASSGYGSYQPFCSLQLFNCTELNNYISG